MEFAHSAGRANRGREGRHRARRRREHRAVDALLLNRDGRIGATAAQRRPCVEIDARFLATTLTLRRFIPIFKEKSRLIVLPNYGCLESLSGQSSMPTGL
jgi:hypothetical protein